MADTGNPKEFLAGALSAVNELAEEKTQLLKDQDSLKKAEYRLSQIHKTVEKEKTELLRKRRSDIETEYQKQLTQAENGIQTAKQNRVKARDTGVKDRIAAETKETKEELSLLKTTLSQTAQLAGLPDVCRTTPFYTLFAPASFREALTRLLVFLAVMILLPFLATCWMERLFARILVFLLLDALFAGLYLLLWQKSLGTAPDAMGKCRELATRIREDKEKIRKTTAMIRKDKDDSCYSLSEYDAEITRQTELKNGILLKRQEALSRFDNETAASLKEEIEKQYRAQLSETETGIAALRASVKSLTEKIADAELSLNGDFTQVLGRENMNRDKIERMISLVENGEAESVLDAVKKANETK